MDKSWILFLFFLSGHGFGQSGVTGEATIHLLDGGTLCLGAARTIQILVDVRGLTGTAGEPAGLNGALIDLNPLDGARTWFARALGGQDNPPFSAVATDATLVASSGMLKLVSWTAGDTPNDDFLVATLVFSGASAPEQGTLTIQITSELASKWWDDGSPRGDGPASMPSNPGPSLQFSIPAWTGLILGQGISFWLTSDGQYDFNAPFNHVNTLDLVELVNCLPAI